MVWKLAAIAMVCVGISLSVSPSYSQASDVISVKKLDPGTKKTFFKKMKSREVELARGVVESNLIPVYPADAGCQKIDHIFGEPWRGPVPNRRHMGADIPANWNEPIIAMADGEVVALFTGDGPGFRGRQVILRHAPADTGLSVWLYTVYTHFNEMPEFEVGQRVRMGQALGPNGKSGVPGKLREPHLHLTINYSTSKKYAVTKGLVVPFKGYFADPVALFRGGMPIDTHAMRALPENERRVKIAYKLKTGEIVPPDAKIIWPFACRPK